METHERAVESPVKCTQLNETGSRLGRGRAPCAKHAASRFDQLWDHVEVDDDRGINTGSVSKTLDFFEEVLRRDGGGRREYDGEKTASNAL